MSEPPPLPSASPAPVGDPKKRSNDASLMMIGGGAAAAVSAFLPWYTVGPFTVNGTAGDGQITLVVGGLLGLFGYLRRSERSVPSWVPIVLAAVIIVVGVYHFGNNSNEEFVSVGVGVYGTIAAGVVGLIGALTARKYPIAAAVRPGLPAGEDSSLEMAERTSGMSIDSDQPPSAEPPPTYVQKRPPLSTRFGQLKTRQRVAILAVFIAIALAAGAAGVFEQFS